MTKNPVLRLSHPAGHRCRLQQRRCPSPLRHDGRGCEADTHLSSRVESRVQVVRIVINVATDLKQNAKPWGSLVEGDKQVDQPNSETRME